MAFVQTADMLELLKRCSPDAGVLITIVSSKQLKSQYKTQSVWFTGIDHEVGNVITFGVGLVSSVSSTCLWWVLRKF